MQKIGYELVKGENEREKVVARLEEAGCKRVFTVERDAKHKNAQSKFERIVNLLQPDDILVITKLEGLGKSLNSVVKNCAKLLEEGVTLHILDGDIYLTPCSGEARMIEYLEKFYYLTNEAQIKARQASLKNRQTKPGRKSRLKDPKTREYIDTLRKNPNYKVEDICKYANISPSTYHNYLKLCREEEEAKEWRLKKKSRITKNN